MGEQETLQKAIQAIQNGDIETGGRLLAQVLQADPTNARAWLWMGDVVDAQDQKADCLRRALSLDLSTQEREDAYARQAQLGLSSTGDREYPEPPAAQRDDRPLFTIRSDVGAADPALTAEQPAPPGTARHASRTLALAGSARALPAGMLGGTRDVRERGYRNTMIAGALLLFLLGGLGLLVHTVTNIVPQAQERLRPTPEAVLYEATLWCPPCQQAGSQIVLWEKVGDGISRGGKTGELPHDIIVSVLAEEWSEPEERRYYKVTALGQKGWIPDTFLKK